MQTLTRANIIMNKFEMVKNQDKNFTVIAHEVNVL